MHTKSAEPTFTEFLEDLPEQCPPAHAVDAAYPVIYRLVTSLNVSADDFKSHAALGKENRTNIDACKWASCSLVKDPTQHINRWPRLKLKDNFVAKLDLKQGCGVSHTKKNNNHVDFWAYSNLDFNKHIVEVNTISAILDEDEEDGAE